MLKLNFQFKSCELRFAGFFSILDSLLQTPRTSIFHFFAAMSQSHSSEINIKIELGEDKMPETIAWQAPDGGVPEFQAAKAMLLGLWDGNEKTAMRIDLWTQKMMVDEMVDFFFKA